MAKRTRIIQVDGRQYEATYIGKGKFSKVYRIGNRAVYYTKGDCTKEVLAMYVYEPKTHLPEIIRHDNVQTRYGEYWYVFSSPFYKDVRKSNISAYRLMLAIIKQYTEFWYEYKHYQYQAYGRVRMSYDVMQEFVNEVKQNKSLPYSVVQALQELIDVSKNCGYTISFDFHKKNFGVNEYGTLIFRDVVYLIG